MSRFRAWAVLAALATSPSLAAAEVEWHPGGADGALADAQQRGLLVLVDCWATWCTYCHRMDREVWSRDDVARSITGRAVPVRVEVDLFNNVGTEFGARYGIDGLPVVLFLHPEDGREIARLSGFATAEQIVAALEAAWRELGRAGDAVGGSVDAATHLDQAARARLLGRTDEALAAARAALATDALCADDIADDAALAIAEIERAAERSSAALAALATAAAACGKADRAAELWSTWALAAGESDGPVAAGEIYERKLALFPRDPEAMIERATWAAEHAETVDDVDAALELARAAEEALPGDPRPAAATARLHAARGEKDAALEALERAITIDPHDRALRRLRLEWTLRGVARRVP